jgi:hypothetical protein
MCGGTPVPARGNLRSDSNAQGGEGGVDADVARGIPTHHAIGRMNLSLARYLSAVYVTRVPKRGLGVALPRHWMIEVRV